MAVILFSPIGTLGDLHPYLAIGLHLRSMGHRPVIATMEAYRERVQEHGLDFHPVGPHFDVHDKSIMEHVLHPTRGTVRLFRDLIVPAMETAHRDILPAMKKADLYISHPLSFGAIAAAREAGTPWVSSVLAPISMMSIHDRCVFPGPVPVHKLRFLGPSYYRVLIALGKASLMRVEGRVRRFFVERGLKPPRHPIFEDQFSPRGTIVLFSRAIGAPQEDWPVHARQVGFPFLDGPHDTNLPPHIEEFLGNGPPPIVYTLGSGAVGVAGDFYEVAARVHKEGGHRAILLVGRGMEEFAPQGDENILVADYAPFSGLFPRVKAVVHSGGIGTVAQVLRAGKPSIVVPFANDQFDNADRLVRHGLGLTLPKSRWDVPHAGAAVERLLGDDKMGGRCNEAARLIGAEGGALGAAEELCGFLRHATDGK